MAKRKVSNLLALAVLSLLNEWPMHPYEIAALMPVFLRLSANSRSHDWVYAYTVR